MDPTYVEDFLLTYRTFLKSPSHVADQLLTWFNDPKTRDRVSFNNKPQNIVEALKDVTQP